MSGKLLTYLDTGVILAVVRSEPLTAVRAYDVLNDPAREFVGGAALELELLPSAIYYQRTAAQMFCETFLHSTVFWVEPSKKLFASALDLASAFGLAALDALHAASAIAAGAQELITTEKPTKQLCPNSPFCTKSLGAVRKVQRWCNSVFL